MNIHPTAVIAPGAVLAPGVEVGAFSVIGEAAVIGSMTVIQSHVVIEGSVQIGRGNIIGHGSVIGSPPQDLAFKPETKSSVVIGDDNVIREHCTIHRGTSEGSATAIGNGNFLMVGVHIGHNCRIGDGVILANNCLLGGYVRIDDRAFIGGGTTFHQYVHVGRLVMAQGMSGFGKDVPPFLMAGRRNVVFGVNVLGLRRAGFSTAERDEIKRAFTLLYRSGLNVRQAVEQARGSNFGPLGREFFDFTDMARKRGVVRYPRSSEYEV